MSFHQQKPKSTQSTRDLYADLEISSKASADEIKKAYRKQAVKHHPDRGGDAEVFKKVSEAHEILSDETKREIYDQHGYDGLQEYQNQMSAQGQMRAQVQPMVVKVVVNLAELYKGCKRSVEAERIIFDGNIQLGGHNLKKTPEKETFEITIDPMSVYGDKIVKTGLGHRHKTDEDVIGDLIFVLVPFETDEAEAESQASKEGQYKGFTLTGLDLHYQCKLTLAEALLGFKKRIEFLDGRQLMISSNKITQPETVKVIEKLGFQKTMRTPFGAFPKQGHMYIHFEIEFPKEIDSKMQSQIAKAFGVPKLDKPSGDTAVVDYKVDQLANPDQVKEQQDGMGMGGPMIIGPDGVPINLAGGQQECTIM
jgi:DnaJ-class molecular chaperone